MSGFEIDLEWPVAKYEFQPAPAEEIEEGLFPILRSRGVREDDLPFYWGRIVRTGKSTKRRSPPEKMRLAVKALVEYKDVPFHVIALRVARALGTLSPKGHDKVRDWYELAYELREMFKHGVVSAQEMQSWSNKSAIELWPRNLPHGHLGVYLISGKDGKPVLALRPDNLFNALKLYGANMIATGTAFNTCENCKTLFLSGGGRSRNKKRGDAKFCSDECRWKFHNESRRKTR